MLILISLLAGIFTAIIIKYIYSFFISMEIEKKFSDKYNQIKITKNKGILGSIFFIAEKIGKYIKYLNFKPLNKLSIQIEDNLNILGTPYNSINSYTFIGVQFLAGISIILVLAVLLNITNFILLFLFGIAGFFAPIFLIKDKIKARHKAIFRQLPDVLDMLTLMVEAGLDFNMAINKIISMEKGVLIDELILVQQEIRIGASRISAFENMSKRIKSIEVNTFVNSLVLSFKTGAGMSSTLRILSEQFRVERMQFAEKKASEAPVKLMFPLVLFIFPTIFIILFGPIFLSFIGN